MALYSTFLDPGGQSLLGDLPPTMDEKHQVFKNTSQTLQMM